MYWSGRHYHVKDIIGHFTFWISLSLRAETKDWALRPNGSAFRFHRHPQSWYFLSCWKLDKTYYDLHWIADCIPPNYTLFSFPRTSKRTPSPAVGGGTGLYPWALHTITHFSHWILLLRIICCHSQTASFQNISIALPHLPHSRNLFLFSWWI